MGLHGGSATDSRGMTKISFDEWYVYDAGGPVIGGPMIAVELQGKLAITWSAIKVSE